MTHHTRRARIVATALALLATPVLAQEKPKALTDLAAIATKKPPVVWSESSEAAAIGKVIATFNKTYPDIKVEFIRDTGGNTLAAKVVQEAQAGGTPAALLSGDPQQLVAIEQRGLLVKSDWKALGVDAALAPTPTLIATAASLGAIVWNKKNVPDAQVPKTLNDLLKPQYTGKVGSWIRAPTYAQLGKLAGEAEVRAFLEKLLTMQPRLYDSTYRLAQEAATGEIDVGFGLWHASQPTIAAGGPIGVALTDPVATSTIFSAIVNKSANPEGAQVLAVWLATREGADAYEEATGRGNPYVAGTKTQKLVEGRKLSEYPIAEMATYVRLQTDFNKMLSSRGTVK